MPITEAKRNEFNKALKSLSPKEQAMFDYIISHHESVLQFPGNDTHVSLSVLTLMPLAKKGDVGVSDNFIEELIRQSGKENLTDKIASFIEGTNFNKKGKIAEFAVHTENFKQERSEEIHNNKTPLRREHAMFNPIAMESGLSFSETIQIQNIPEPLQINYATSWKSPEHPAKSTAAKNTPQNDFTKNLTKFLTDKNATDLISLNSEAVKNLAKKFEKYQTHQPNKIKALLERKEIDSLCKEAGLNSTGKLHKEVRNFIKEQFSFYRGAEQNSSREK